MSTATRPFTCLQCRLRTIKKPPRRPLHTSPQLQRKAEPLPTTAPPPSVNIKHKRENPELYAQNSLDRNYRKQSEYPQKIKNLFDTFQKHQRDAEALRGYIKRVRLQIANPTVLQAGDFGPLLKAKSHEELRKEAKELKEKISEVEETEQGLVAEIERMAAAIPNLTSEKTPIGTHPDILGYINTHPSPEYKDDGRSHVDIGTDLQLLDFAAAATTTGWGYYYLLNEAALLEQALVQYALSVARKAGWSVVSPPSMVYSHIAAACGFQPRDVNGEQQVYSIAQAAHAVKKPELSLAGTAEIPLAGMKADTTLQEHEMPVRRAGVSRCYRAEAGARGVGTKGLYRVHEFTKVELFAWTMPNDTSVFESLLKLQTDILTSLGLHCRILEMPSTDLGASAMRKIDIEAFFPSRRSIRKGWGEVTSVSMCGDYQSRRLATKVDIRELGGKVAYPWTVNGTALAVPRVLAAILENGWDGETGQVKIPECLWPWMDGVTAIGPK